MFCVSRDGRACVDVSIRLGVLVIAFIPDAMAAIGNRWELTGRDGSINKIVGAFCPLTDKKSIQKV